MNRFPYTNFHDINLDWIVKQIKDFASNLNALAQRLATFVSLPAGGSTGEALVKRSNANYDVEWDTIQAGVTSVDGKTGAVTVLPVAGGTGQALVKRSAANYDVEWDTISGGASVYYAEYGVTSVADIYAEYSDNKIVLCEYSGNIYSLFNCSPTLAHFSYINENVSRVLEVVGSVWTYTSKTLAIESNVHDIPQGGTAGQALTKIDSQDYNVQWQTISGSGAVDSVDGKTGNVTVLPVGGTADQVLAKVDGTNYNVYWKTVPGGGGSPELFIAEYGTTTYADISAAVTADQLVLLHEPSGTTDYYIPLTALSTLNALFFSPRSSSIRRYEVDTANSWSYTTAYFATVPTTSPTTGQVLRYAAGMWRPFTLIAFGTITFSASWTDSGNGYYTQTVTVTGATVTSNSKVDMQLDTTTYSTLNTAGTTMLFIENNAGTLTAYLYGTAPAASFTLDCTVTEVV